jgi:hypothetical protein
MEYAARLPRFPSVVTLLVTLLVGGAVATGAYALIDDDGTTTATKTIVVEQPGPNAADIAGKNEASTAAAISPSQPADIAGKNESATAAAITQSSGVELRGSKASSGGIPSPAAAEELRQDPHGPGISLRNP